MEKTIGNVRLSDLTTLRVGGVAESFCLAESAEELTRSVMDADGRGKPLFVIGGGSNVLVGDDGFEGAVVKPAFAAVRASRADEDRVEVTAEAGCIWDELVSWCVERSLAGIEALSGIPGMIGSAVVQNIGAYGQEMGSCLVRAKLYDRATGSTTELLKNELELGYRTSKLRKSMEQPVRAWRPTPRWVVLEATFSLVRGGYCAVAHQQLARALECGVGDRLDVAEVREAVLGVRAQKGMVVDPDPLGPDPQHDRWSTGSFFTNPVIDEERAARLPDDAPRYDSGVPGMVKTSAAWLIERAGFERGFGVGGPSSPATLSRLHTLALTNRGTARASDVVELARTVRAGVLETFGIELVPETVLVGVEL